MSSDPENDPICSNPPRNADMDGAAVAVANVIVHWCLRIVVTYSDGDIDLAIQSLLVQFYPILLSTLLSIKRQQLSIFDTEFALLIGSSPLVIYVSFASVCDLCGYRTGLFKRIKSQWHRNIIRIFGALVPFLWTALSMIVSFSNNAFLDSPCHPTSSFLDWVKNTILYLLLTFASLGRGNSLPGLGLLALVPFLILLFRRRSQVWAEVRRSLGGASRWRVPLAWVKCAWCTIDRRHKWSIHFLFAFIDILWSVLIIMAATTTHGEKYVLSYGQLLSILCILPTLASTIKFLFFTRPKVHFADYRSGDEVRYLFTGREPDYPIEDTRLSSNGISRTEQPTVGKLCDQVVVSVLPTCQPTHSPELGYVDEREQDMKCSACGATPVNNGWNRG